jgi:hypothetical protein
MNNIPEARDADVTWASLVIVVAYYHDGYQRRASSLICRRWEYIGAPGHSLLLLSSLRYLAWATLKSVSAWEPHLGPVFFTLFLSRF